MRDLYFLSTRDLLVSQARDTLHVVLLVIKVAAKEVIQQHCPQRIMQVKATVLYFTINQPAACWCPWRERTKLGKLHKKTTKSFIEPNTKKCEPPLHPRRSHSSCSTAMNASVVLPKRNERQWGLVWSRPCSNRVHPLLPRSPTAPGPCCKSLLRSAEKAKPETRLTLR